MLVEVERLRGVQAELTAELAALHTDLEKERSKNAQDPRTKDKVKGYFSYIYIINNDSSIKFMISRVYIFIIKYFNLLVILLGIIFFQKHPNKKKNIRFDVSSEAILSKESSSGTGY